MRAFLVLVNEAKCDLANGGQIKCSLTCHTVLVGPAASVEKVQAACMGISHAEGVIWKNREQVRAM
jgi:hypothetical protein